MGHMGNNMELMSQIKEFVVNGHLDRDIRGKIGVVIYKIENQKPLTVKETNLFHKICDMLSEI